MDVHQTDHIHNDVIRVKNVFLKNIGLIMEMDVILIVLFVIQNRKCALALLRFLTAQEF